MSSRRPVASRTAAASARAPSPSRSSSSASSSRARSASRSSQEAAPAASRSRAGSRASARAPSRSPVRSASRSRSPVREVPAPVVGAKKGARKAAKPRAPRDNITAPAVKRIEYRAGIQETRDAKNVYDKIVHQILLPAVSRLVKASKMVAEHSGRLTVTPADVKLALSLYSGKTVLLANHLEKVTDTKPAKKTPKEDSVKSQIEEAQKESKKTRRGKVALKKITSQQKSQKLSIPVASFEREVRAIADDLGFSKYRFPKQTTHMIQQLVEYLTVSVLYKANIIARHAGRVGVVVSDIEIALSLSK